jgi:enoyl-CoA hydratase
MEYINLNIEGKNATLTINKEKSLNALNRKVLEELNHAIDTARNEEVRVLFIEGAGDKAFVAGADISEMINLKSADAKQFAELGHKVFSKLETSKFVTIARVDGFALGGGFELALACDVVFATEKSKFGLPEVGLGLIPGFGGTQRLSRSVGLHTAKALTLSGDMVSADFLSAKGVVYKVCKDLEEMNAETLSYAKRISTKGPAAVATAKMTIQKGYSLKAPDALILEQQEFALLFGTKEASEGMKAFTEKRKPEF